MMAIQPMNKKGIIIKKYMADLLSFLMQICTKIIRMVMPMNGISMRGKKGLPVL